MQVHASESESQVLAPGPARGTKMGGTLLSCNRAVLLLVVFEVYRPFVFSRIMQGPSRPSKPSKDRRAVINTATVHDLRSTQFFSKVLMCFCPQSGFQILANDVDTADLFRQAPAQAVENTVIEVSKDETGQANSVLCLVHSGHRLICANFVHMQ